MVTLRPMTQADYDQFAGAMWEDYAQVGARNSGMSIEDARAFAAKQRAELVPNELQTPGHRFWVVENAERQRVGVLWVQLRDAQHLAFIYNIEMDPAERGKGYGRQALEALEAEMRPLGITKIGLNVFGDNTVAMRLYQSMGYQTVATNMQKDI